MNFDFAFFDKGIDRRCTQSEKWDCEDMRPGMLPMWVADMDFESAPAIRDALVARAKHAAYGYTFSPDEDLDALIAFNARRHGETLAREEIVPLPCVVTGLKASVLALTKAGDRVVVQPPVYGPFYAAIRDNGRTVCENPLLRDANGRYHMDLPALEAQLKTGVSLMLLCSPHNPISRVWSREELRALFALLARYNVPVVADEIHQDFLYPEHPFTPALEAARDVPELRAAALLSASKTFNIAGLQQAALVSRDAGIREGCARVMNEAGVKWGNIFALTATRAAYSACDDWLDGLTRYLDAGRALLLSEMARELPEVRVTPIDATYLAWLDMRALGGTTKDWMRRAEDAGVLFTPGTFFGQEAGEGFLRFNFGCPHASVAEAVKRLRKAARG